MGTCLSQSPRPPFQGGDQGLRAFHRRNGFPCPPTPARHLMMPASPSDVRAKELRGFLLPYTPGASRNCLMLRGLTDFRVVKITTLKSSKSLIISVLWVAPLRSAVLPPFKSGGSTLESDYPSQESCHPTSDDPSATVSVLPHRLRCSCHRIRVLLPPNPSRSTSGVGCSYFCNRVVPPLRVLLPLYPFYPTA